MKFPSADTMDATCANAGRRLNENTGSACILVFVRVPEIGKVKTRLAKGIGSGSALGFYRLCVEKILATLDETGFPVIICHHPEEKEDALFSWLGRARTFFPQDGPDLGHRMVNAFKRAFESGATRIVLVGTDIPGLTPAVIDDALSFLNRIGAVIGPASDGGYYLIGFREDAFDPLCFSDIEWGTEAVFQQTIQRFSELKIAHHTLPVLTDIDTREDLDDYRHQNPGHWIDRYFSQIFQPKEAPNGDLLQPGGSVQIPPDRQ